MNNLYDSSLIMLTVVLVSMPLGTPETIKGTVKLATAIAVSSMAVKWVQDKKYIPINPLKYLWNNGQYNSWWIIQCCGLFGSCIFIFKIKP